MPTQEGRPSRPAANVGLNPYNVAHLVSLWNCRCGQGNHRTHAKRTHAQITQAATWQTTEARK